MALAETEYRRFADALRALLTQDWAKPTDCERWDVRAMVLHVLGAMEGNASLREMLHQQRLGPKLGKQIGGSSLDGVNELQVRERDHLHGDELVERLASTIDRAVKGRRRFPAPLRRVKLTLPAPWTGKRTLGWLNDIVYTRDTWMHRVDLAYATGTDLMLTPEHDGRLIADVVADWARIHGQPFHLVLTGPAGGHYHRPGPTGDHRELDAIEFCRTISGRETRPGLLATPVPF
ncbi:MAG: maleylpyruvate isomerase family mycothiol-dependent enzyme [Actinomycetota bacterium]|nr:maleylpyruvate isomerase family mycothiol-dependent enzyme [Actinomycetota bacterium]